ncbi:MAG: hypothetical protein ACOYJG_10820 [Prevotella sp.]|jgi:hypothetical protein
MKTFLLSLLISSLWLMGTNVSCTKGNKAPIDSMLTRQVTQRVEALYKHQFSKEVLEGRTPDTMNVYSDDFNRVMDAASKVGQEAGIIGWNFNHWGMAQDYIHPEMHLIEVKVIDRIHATALVKITDTNFPSHIVMLKLVFEHGNWQVDDFIDMSTEEHQSEKESTIRDIKEAGYGSLLSDDGQNDTLNYSVMDGGKN